LDTLIHQLRFLGSQQHPSSGVLLTSYSTWETENCLAKLDLESTGGDKVLWLFGRSKISKHLQLCGRAKYRATSKNVESRNPLSGSEELRSSAFSKILLSFLVRFEHLSLIFYKLPSASI
jgi:hypothetical protein